MSHNPLSLKITTESHMDLMSIFSLDEQFLAFEAFVHRVMQDSKAKGILVISRHSNQTSFSSTYY